MRQRMAYVADLELRREYREALLERFHEDEEALADFITHISQKTGQAYIDFCDILCSTFDPREDIDGEPIGKVPFILDEEQREFLHWYALVENLPGKRAGHVVKSRDRGCTWMMSMIRLHHWIFFDGYIALVGHQTEDDIDKHGEQKCIFWKFDFLLTNLEMGEYLVPEDWNAKQWSQHLIRINPENGNIFKGDPVTNTWGGGDRVTDAWIDEAGECIFGREGYNKVGFTCNMRWTTGTPPRTGMSNWWSQIVVPLLRTEGKRAGNNCVFEMTWERDPRYNYHYTNLLGMKVYPWYDQQRELFNDETLARELGRNFVGAMVGQVYPQIRLSRTGAMDYDPRLPLYLSVDPGLNDKFGFAWFQPDGNSHMWRLLQTYMNRGKSAYFYMGIILGLEYESFMNREDCSDEDIEIAKRTSDWIYDGFIGDPSGRSGTLTDKDKRSVYDLWTQETKKRTPHRYIPSVTYDVVNGKDFQVRIHHTRSLLSHLVINERWCAGARNAIEQCRFPEESEKSMTEVKGPLHSTPGRDLVTAIEYFAISPAYRFRRQAKSVDRIKPVHAFGDLDDIPDPEEETEERERKVRSRLSVMRRVYF